MFDADEIEPNDSPEIFERDDDDAAVQQAAMLVLYAVALVGGKSDELAAEIVGWTSLDELPEPLPPTIIDDAWELIDLATETFAAELDELERFRGPVRAQAAIATALLDRGTTYRVWQRLRDSRDPYDSLGWIAAHLWSRHALLRAAAAASLAVVSPAAQFLVPLLLRHAESLDDVERSLGEVGLRSLSTETALASASASVIGHDPGTQDETSILLNGTFTGLCRPSHWFWPTGEMADLIRSDVVPDLYHDEHSFFWWGGAYSTPARDAAALQLDEWAQRRSMSNLHVVVAHSHGGNVALDYLDYGGTIELLVLLHTPIIDREPTAWQGIASRVERVLILNTRFDWVVWLDRARAWSDQRHSVFDHLESRIGHKAITLSGSITRGWWAHEHFTKADVWRRHNIAKLVSAQHRELHMAG
jgi:hypothetical protein